MPQKDDATEVAFNAAAEDKGLCDIKGWIAKRSKINFSATTQIYSVYHEHIRNLVILFIWEIFNRRSVVVLFKVWKDSLEFEIL